MILHLFLSARYAVFAEFTNRHNHSQNLYIVADLCKNSAENALQRHFRHNINIFILGGESTKQGGEFTPYFLIRSSRRDFLYIISHHFIRSKEEPTFVVPPTSMAQYVWQRQFAYQSARVTLVQYRAISRATQTRSLRHPLERELQSLYPSQCDEYEDYAVYRHLVLRKLLTISPPPPL